jgi:hypothetical protein
MLAWGDRWHSKGKPPLLLRHSKCEHDFHASVICDKCHKPIVAADMQYKLNYDPKEYGALGPRSIT